MFDSFYKIGPVSSEKVFCSFKFAFQLTKCTATQRLSYCLGIICHYVIKLNEIMHVPRLFSLTYQYFARTFWSIPSYLFRLTYSVLPIPIPIPLLMLTKQVAPTLFRCVFPWTYIATFHLCENPVFDYSSEWNPIRRSYYRMLSKLV